MHFAHYSLVRSVGARSLFHRLLREHPSYLIFNPFYSIRSPGPVAPKDIECEGFDLTYTRIAGDKSSRTNRAGGGGTSHPTAMENDIDQKVDDAIESFLRSLSQIGPELLSVSLLEGVYLIRLEP
jgi:hypothetical protein